MEAILLRIFVEIDLLIHQGIAEVFKLIFRIAEEPIFDNGAIESLANRVYGILGVFILFKIVISAVQYLVNPDKLMEKEKGMAGLFQRTIISIALLALVPTIFDVAKEVETSVAGVIPVIILGQEVDYSTTDGESVPEKVGSWMSFVTLKAFITEKEGKNTQNYPMNNFDDFYNNVTHGCGWLFADDNCIFDYNFIFSIAVGVFMLYVLLSMGIDIAIRTIKLGILELLAPIPIASYINNQENFKAWYQNAFKVYADLFIRLIVIYFIVYVMSILGQQMAEELNNEGVAGIAANFIKDPFVKIYIIIGLLMFAKQAPKFICDILGIKSDGFGSIGEMFKRPLGFAGAAKGTYDTIKSNYRTQYDRLGTKTDKNGNKLSKGKVLAGALKSAAAGGGSAFARGMWMATQGKGYNEIRTTANKKAVEKRNERNTFHDKFEKDGYTWRDYKRDQRNARIGILNTSNYIETQTTTIDEIKKSFVASKDHGAKKMNEKPDEIISTTKGFGKVSDGDGVLRDINSTSIAQVRAMTSIPVDSLYDDGKAKERSARIIAESEKEYQRVLANYNIMKTAAIKSPGSISEAQMKDIEFRLEMARDDLKNKRVNADKIGLVRMTKEVSAQWAAVQQNIEKEYAYVSEANLLSAGDPDSIRSHEDSLKLLRDNRTLFISDPQYNEILEKTSKACGVKFESIDDLIKIMERKDQNGNYDMTSDELKAAKTAFERIGAAAYPKYLEEKERAERSAKAAANDNK